MPIDWDQFDEEVEIALDRAEALTDESLAGRVSSLTRLTDEEVKALFPTPADVKHLGELLKIVKSAESQNEKKNRLIANIGSLGATVVTLLEAVA